MSPEVTGKNKLPNNWNDFLHNTVNKQQLFLFVSHKLESMECVEEETGTKILIHLQDALDNGATIC